MKKWLALCLMCLLLISVASAEESDIIVTYALPEGATECHVAEAATLVVPDGLDPLYGLMSNASPHSDAYLISMPYGHAIISVCCTTVTNPGDAQSLLALWPQVAQSIAADVNYINDSDQCAATQERWGFETLHIDTDIAVGGEEMLLLDAQGWAFYRGNDLLEVWAVCPSDSIYLYNDTAMAQLQSDCEEMNLLLDSMDFSGASAPEPTSLGSTPVWPVLGGDIETYADPSGAFSLSIPAGGIVLGPDASQSDFDAVGERFIAANPAGAGNVFESWFDDAQEYGATLIITPNLKAAFQLSTAEIAVDGLSAEDLLSMGPSIEETLTAQYGLSVLMNKDIWRINGIDRAHMSYWVRCEELNMGQEIIVHVADGWIYEVDWFAMSDDTSYAEQQAMLGVMLNTLTYEAPGTPV